MSATLVPAPVSQNCQPTNNPNELDSSDEEKPSYGLFEDTGDFGNDNNLGLFDDAPSDEDM